MRQTDLPHVPNVFKVEDLHSWSVTASIDDHPPILARPMGLQGLCFFRRFSVAWDVFWGRMDAVKWQVLPPKVSEEAKP